MNFMNFDVNDVDDEIAWENLGRWIEYAAPTRVRKMWNRVSESNAKLSKAYQVQEMILESFANRLKGNA